MKKWLLLPWFFFLVGCHIVSEKEAPVRYDRPLPPGGIALEKVAELPDFTEACYRLDDLAKAIDRSLNYLDKPSSKAHFPVAGMTHDRVKASLSAFKELLDQGLTGPALNRAVRERFDAYRSVGCDQKGTVLFTGYYTPIFSGSFEKSRKYRFPLYKLPRELKKDSHGRAEWGSCPDRAELERSRRLAGQELVWLADPFAVYVTHVQGSARIRLPQGELITAGYAGNNGHSYRSVSRELVQDGLISADKMSLAAMEDFFRLHPEKIREYTNRNPRFVFFCRDKGPPRGCLNEPVTPMRTLATDKSIFPRASLVFFSTSLLRPVGDRISKSSYEGFACDQDTGGAIRAPGRCDVYMGQGDLAGRAAGQTYREGSLYYLFLKPKERVP